MAYREPMTRGARRAEPGASPVWLAHPVPVGRTPWYEAPPWLFNECVNTGRFLLMRGPGTHGRST